MTFIKILRLLSLSLLLLASQFAARALPAVSMSETWQERFVTNPITHTVSIVTNGSASFTFSGLTVSAGNTIGFTTFFIINTPGGYLATSVSGNSFDPVNPSTSTYTPGATSATITFYQVTTDTNGHPHYALNKILKLNWAKNVLSGSFTGVSGTLGLERFVVDRSPLLAPVFIPVAIGFGSDFTVVPSVLFGTNNVASGFPFNTGKATITSDFTPPTITITSPAANFSSTNPLMMVNGTVRDNLSIFATQFRLAAPTDDPTLPGAYGWLGAGQAAAFGKSSAWSALVPLAPGTNWFWAQATDLTLNRSTVVTRKFFYSVRSPLTLITNGNGTIIGGKGVTNGAMLEIGRGYSLTAKPNDTNTVFRDWRDGSFNLLSNANPWNFLMQDNMTIIGNFVPNPFPAIVGTYSGTFYDSGSALPPSIANSGYITITVKPDGTYSGSAIYNAQRLPVTGKLQFDTDETDGDAVNGISAIGKGTNVTARIRFPSDGSGVGVLVGAPTVIMTVSNHVFQPVPLTLASNVIAAGLYNMSDFTIEPNPPTNSIGCSYGSIIVTSTGQANVILHLPDGSAPVATFSAPVGIDGTVPFFIPLYRGKGFVMGNVTLNSARVQNAGLNFWVKQQNPRDRYFADGFTNAMFWGGIAYTSTNTGINFLEGLHIVRFEIRTRDIIVVADGIFVPASNSFIIPPWQGGSTLRLKLNPVTGLISGSVTVNGHSFSNLNVLVGRADGFACGYGLTSSNSTSIFIWQEDANSLGNYDDGFVFQDDVYVDPYLGFTVYFSFNNTSQLIADNSQIFLHKTVQVSPHQQFVLIDTFQSGNISLPQYFTPLVAPPYTGPTIYTNLQTVPAVTLRPVSRDTQYISN